MTLKTIEIYLDTNLKSEFDDMVDIQIRDLRRQGYKICENVMVHITSRMKEMCACMGNRAEFKQVITLAKVDEGNVVREQ